MFFKTGELFLKTTLKNWKKTCLKEFRQCCEIKVVTPNILFQGRIIRIRTVCKKNSAFDLYTAISFMFESVNESLLLFYLFFISYENVKPRVA